MNYFGTPSYELNGQGSITSASRNYSVRYRVQSVWSSPTFGCGSTSSGIKWPQREDDQLSISTAEV